MPRVFCDLHAHSTASDGTDAPASWGELAVRAGLAAVAMTDHDTTAGLHAARARCEAAGVDWVPGIELSCDPGRPVGTMHLLGLFIDGDDPVLAALCERVQRARAQRNPRIVQRLNELGVPLTYGQVLEYAREQGSAIVGRPHIAQCLVQRGMVRDVSEAFRLYIGQGAPAYVRRDALPVGEAIDAIHHAGGVAVLAHPIQLRYDGDDELAHGVQRLAEWGLDGIEVMHSDHDASWRERAQQLALRFDLLPSGGSDYHGQRKAIPLGSQRVPLDWCHALREAAKR